MKSLTEQALKAYVNHEKYFERGRVYFRAGDVVLDEVTDQSIQARVVGT
jgi:uncharacterized Zn finger protein